MRDRRLRTRVRSLVRTPSSIAAGYTKATPVFGVISRQFESHARVKSLALSELTDGQKVLVLAPPTEYFIGSLVARNPHGETDMVAFSPDQAAEARKHVADLGCGVSTGTPARLPFDSDTFDVIFAYCFLDFLSETEMGPAAAELMRVQRGGGRLLATYLGRPRRAWEHVSVPVLTKAPLIASGVRALDVTPALRDAGFTRVAVHHCPQKGLPIELVYAVKPQ